MRVALRGFALLLLLAGIATVNAVSQDAPSRRLGRDPVARDQGKPGSGAAAAKSAGGAAGCSSGLPATGQTVSYGAGSDGDVQAGGSLRYRDHGDGTITDLSTGLVWEKKADYDNRDVNCTTIAACPNPHDADNRYLWSRSGTALDGPLATVFLAQLNEHCDADATVRCTSDADCAAAGGPCGFAGHRDWRIPNWKELASIVNYGFLAPSVSPELHRDCTGSCTVRECSCTVPNVHWVSSTHLEDPTWGGYVSFYDGNVHGDSKHHAFFVRAVRGGPSAASPRADDGRPACAQPLPASGQTTAYGAASDGAVRAGAPLDYRDNGDGTVSDLVTGLTWEKKADYDNAYVECADAATCPDPHDADNRYRWGAGTELDGTVVTVFLEQLNNGCHGEPARACTTDADCDGAGGRCGFAGMRDWRLPNAKELQSIVAYEKVRPSVSPAFDRDCASSCGVEACSCTAPGTYWTSTTYPADPEWAQFVGFFDGNMYAEAKTAYHFARAVRGGR